MNWSALGAREKFLIIAGVAALIGLGVYQLVYRPAFEKVDSVKLKIKKTEAKLRDLKTGIPRENREAGTLTGLEQKKRENMRVIDHAENELPSMGHLSQLLGELARVAEPLKLESIHQKIDSGEVYSRVFIEIRFMGQFYDTIHYVKTIQTISPYLKIEEAEIREPKVRKAGEGHEVRLLVSTLLGNRATPRVFKATDVVDDVARPERSIFVRTKKPKKEKRKLKFDLSGIAVGPSGPTAIIDGDVVRSGSTLGSFTVTEILTDSVKLSDGAEEFILEIKDMQQAGKKR